MPLAGRVPDPPLAFRMDRRGAARGSPWRRLCRLLLDADGPALRRRSNEPAVDRDTDVDRGHREAAPARRMVRPRCGCCTVSVGHGPDRRLISARETPDV